MVDDKKSITNNPRRDLTLAGIAVMMKEQDKLKIEKLRAEINRQIQRQRYHK